MPASLTHPAGNTDAARPDAFLADAAFQDANTLDAQWPDAFTADSAVGDAADAQDASVVDASHLDGSVAPDAALLGQPWNGPYHWTWVGAGVTVDLYANIVTAGIHVQGAAPQLGATAWRYRESAGGPWTQGHPFAPVVGDAPPHWAASAWGLKPASCYDFELTLGGSVHVMNGCTQPDTFAFTPSRTLHVARGAAGTGTGSAGAPFGTIQQAMDNATAGDRILVGPGTYHEHLTTRGRSGAPNAWIQMVPANGLGTVVIDGATEGVDLGALDGWQPWTGWTELGCNLPIDPNGLWTLDLSSHPAVAALSGTQVLTITRDGMPLYMYDPFRFGGAANDPAAQQLQARRLVAMGVRCATTCRQAPEGFWFDATTKTLFVRSLTDPRQHELLISTGGFGLTMSNSSWWWIEGLEFRHSAGNRAGGITGGGNCDHNVIRGNRFFGAGSAINLDSQWPSSNTAFGDSNRVEFNNVTHGGVAGLFFDLEKNNRMFGAGSVSIHVNGGTQNIMRGNHIHDSSLGIGAVGLTYPELYDVFRPGYNVEADIYDNNVELLNSNSLHIEDQFINARVFGNRVKDTLVGFAMVGIRSGSIWLVRNIIHNGRNGTKRLAPSTFEPHAFYYHNTIINTDRRPIDEIGCGLPAGMTPDEALCQLPMYRWTPGPPVPYATAPTDGCAYLDYTWSSAMGIHPYSINFLFRNNIFMATSKVVLHTDAPAIRADSLLMLDYNAYHRAGLATPYGGLVQAGSTFNTVEALRSQTGLEAHGVQVDPGFTSSSATYEPVLGLQNMGMPIDGINQDSCGLPDLGAVEICP